MALGLPVSTGESRPYVKYDAKAGRATKVDRFQDAAGNWQASDTDITFEWQFMADLAKIKVGYINYPTGAAPEKALVEYGQPLPARPNLDHRPGFEMMILLPGEKVPREFGSTSQATIGEVNKLHDLYLAAPEAKAGMLPIVALTGTSPVKSGGGKTNYAPLFTVMGWQPRPAAFDIVEAVAPPPPVQTFPARSATPYAPQVAFNGDPARGAQVGGFVQPTTGFIAPAQVSAAPAGVQAQPAPQTTPFEFG